MDELIEVMSDILLELREMNHKLDDIVYGSHSLFDVCMRLESVDNTLDEIKGSGPWDSISDVYEKLDEIQHTVSSIEDNV